MNKYILIGLMLICSSISYGQSRINFTSGINISNLTQDLVSQYGFDTFRDEYIVAGGSATSEVKNSVRVGFYISTLVDFKLNESIFLRSGLKFMNTGDSYFFKTDDVVLQSSSGSETDEKYKFRQRQGYLSIPVILVKPVNDKIEIYGGFSSSFNVSNVLRANYFDVDGDDVKIKWDKEDNPIQANNMVLILNVGMNYIFKVGGMDWMLDFGFNHSLSSVYNDSNADSAFTKAKFWNLDMGIGVRI